MFSNYASFLTKRFSSGGNSHEFGSFIEVDNQGFFCLFF